MPPLAGLVDRIGPRPVVIAAEVIQAAGAVTFVAARGPGPGSPGLSAAVVLVAAALFGAGQQLSTARCSAAGRRGRGAAAGPALRGGQHPRPGEPGAGVFPYVVTTYRVTEHHTAGGMSRTVPHLSELQPEMFCEVSPALAAERGLPTAGGRRSCSARTAIEARVLVTERVPDYLVDGRMTHVVGLPYHWGTEGHRDR